MALPRLAARLRFWPPGELWSPSPPSREGGCGRQKCEAPSPSPPRCLALLCPRTCRGHVVGVRKGPCVSGCATSVGFLGAAHCRLPPGRWGC